MASDAQQSQRRRKDHPPLGDRIRNQVVLTTTGRVRKVVSWLSIPNDCCDALVREIILSGETLLGPASSAGIPGHTSECRPPPPAPSHRLPSGRAAGRS